MGRVHRHKGQQWAAVKPMLATPAPQPPVGDWSHEVKWDGMRCLVTAANGRVRLHSRNGNDVTAAFPDFLGLRGRGTTDTLGEASPTIAPDGRRAAAPDLLLDSEIVTLGADGLPDFSALSRRIGVRVPRRAAELAGQSPATLVIFDVLHLDGEPVMGLPLRERRRLLESLELPSGPWALSEVFEDGSRLWEVTGERGLEGVVSKRWGSRYQPGVRSEDWVKCTHRQRHDLVVVGWRGRGSGSHRDIASLALAEVDHDGGMRWRGTVGSGLGQAAASILSDVLPDPLGEPGPIRGLDPQPLSALGFLWVPAHVVVEVRSLGEQPTGMLRQPVLDRVRTDVSAEDLGVMAAESGHRGQPVTSGATSTSQRAATPADEVVTVRVAGRHLSVKHLDKVMYPKTGTTKAEVLQYYAAVAPRMMAWLDGRPITRIRWPDGVGSPAFFEKNLPAWTPPWIPRVTIVGKAGSDSITYPVLDESARAALVWMVGHGALELHVPQWRVVHEVPQPPDRLIVDLDPGAPAGLAECARAALLIRERLLAEGIAAEPVLSGSKGLHLYGPWQRKDAPVDLVRRLAVDMARTHPELIVATMTPSLRAGKVLIDWSQNQPAKTTLCPWSLRGTQQPQVASPISWEEVAVGGLRQRTLTEVMEQFG